MKSACIVFTLTALLLAAVPQSTAEVPELIGYQGRLLDGTDLVAGQVTVVFRLYTQATAGAAQYAETQTVTAVDGLFATYIGMSNAVPGALTAVFTNASVFLELQADGTVLTPRERLASAPYALTASGVADGGVTATMLADDSVTSAKIVNTTIRDEDISSSAAIKASKIQDGAGSGLDADLLDGRHAGDFLRNDIDDTTRGTLTVNGTGEVLSSRATAADEAAGKTPKLQVQSSAGAARFSVDEQGNVTATSFDGDGSNLTDVTPADDSVTSAKIANNTIRDEDISSSAAISPSKIKDGAGSGLDADLLDSRHADSFLRSDTSDNFTSGTLAINSGASLDVRGTLHMGTTVLKAGSGLVANLNSDLLDSHDSRQFLRSDIDDTTTGTLTVNGTSEMLVSRATAGDETAGDVPKLQVQNSIGGLRFSVDEDGDVTANSFSGNGSGLTSVEPRDNSVTTAKILNNTIRDEDIFSSASISPSKIKDGSGSGLDADLIDGLHGTSVLRSNASDQYTAGTLTLNPGTTLDVNGTLRMDGTVLKTGSGLVANFNADLLDSLTSKDFLRSNASGSFASGTLSFNSGTTLDVNGTLTTEDIRVGSNSASDDDSIFFDGGTARYLRWDNSADEFLFSSTVRSAFNFWANGHVLANDNVYVGYGASDDDDTLYFDRTSEYLRWYDSSGYFYLTDDLTVNGNVTKSGGSFRIDHPQDPANKYLYHSFVESPDMKNVYDGVAVLDGNGEAEVTMPEWFGTLNRDFRYQLTCIGRFAPLYIAEEIADNRFRIAGGSAGMKVSWQLTGIRQDAYANAHRIPVEEEKPGDEKGTYLHPELFGQTAAVSVQ